MTADTEATRGDPDRAEARPSARRIALAALRVTGSVAVLGTLYYVLPLDRASLAAAVVMLVVGLAGFVVLAAVQVGWIVRSPHPGLRAVEALATSTAFFLLLFAATYVTLAAQSPGSFGGPLSHSDGLYFTVTVFSTVGFGDIAAKTEPARLLVTGQMLTDLIIYGLALKIITGAVQRGRQRRHAAQVNSTEGKGR